MASTSVETLLKRRMYREYAKQDSEAIKAFPIPLGLLNKVIALMPPLLPLDHFDRKRCDTVIDRNIWALKELYDIKDRIRERKRLKPSSAENERLRQALEAYLNKRLQTVAGGVSLESYSGHEIKVDAATLKSMLFPPTYFDTFKHHCCQSYPLSPLRFLLLAIPVILALIATPFYCIYLGGKKLFSTRQQGGKEKKKTKKRESIATESPLLRKSLSEQGKVEQRQYSSSEEENMLGNIFRRKSDDNASQKAHRRKRSSMGV